MVDFSRRASTPELMDTEECGFETFRDCLVDLAGVNRLSLAYRPTLAFLEGLRRSGRWPRERPLAIVDVGSGYGDMLRQIDRWAGRRGMAVDLTGVDLNPWSARAAREATRPTRPIRWVTADVFDHRQGEVDVVVSSLFAHHLEDSLLVQFLAHMERTARIGWFVNDLHRHPLPYHFFRRFSQLMGWHRFVQHDGPVSISRAFTAADWRRLLAAASIPADGVEVAWRFPFRLCVSRVRSP